MLEVPHQNGFHPASCSSPLPSSHTPSPGLSNGSPGSNPAEVKNKSDFRPANLKVVIPNSTGPPQSHQQSGSLETGGLLGISRGHDDVSTVQSRFSNTQFSDKSWFSDYFAEDHFFSTYIKTSHLVTVGYFLPLWFSDIKLGFFQSKMPLLIIFKA